MLYLNPDSLCSSPFGGAPSLESGFMSNNSTENEYTKTELEDKILKPILKVLNYKIQNDRWRSKKYNNNIKQI